MKDNRTGTPIANARVVIWKASTTALFFNHSAIYASTTSMSDGSYTIKFTPKGSGKYSVEISPVSSYTDLWYGGAPPKDVQPGKDNDLDFALERYIRLTIHLQNKSNQGKTDFHYTILGCCGAFAGEDINHVVIDTTFTLGMSQLNDYTFQSVYFNGRVQSGPNNGAFIDSVSFRMPFHIGTQDTSINVINP